MKITTKYDINQEVYFLRLGTESHKIYCELCGHTGLLIIQETEKKVKCPECSGYGYQWSEEVYEWIIEGLSTIGQVRYENTYNNDIQIRYMIEKTGVGSGTIHYEYNLFLTEEDAQKECTYRNVNKMFDRNNSSLQKGVKRK